jgi:hypothetical protein
MLYNLPIDILSYINTFNYVIEQKLLKCVAKKFNMVQTKNFVDELTKYSTNFSVMGIAHKDNPLYFSVPDTKDKYFNNFSLLKNIWWFGVNTLFDVKKDVYVVMFDIDLPL